MANEWLQGSDNADEGRVVVDRGNPLSPSEAQAFVDRALRTPDSIALTAPLRQRSQERHFDISDVRRVLPTGYVEPACWDDHYQNWKYRITGTPRPRRDNSSAPDPQPIPEWLLL